MVSALEGPSIMPGGQKEAYRLVADVLEEISAKARRWQTMCDFIGPQWSQSLVVLTAVSVR